MAQHQLAKVAAAAIAHQVATHGVLGVLDKTIDYAAFAVAVRIKNQQLLNQGQSNAQVLSQSESL
jgi:hypothetical protein